MLSERILACCMALILLWFTSLRVSVSIASHYLGLVSVQTIASTVSKNTVFVEDERKKYAKCIKRELNECLNGLEGDVAEESGRVQSVKERNRALVQDRKDRLGSCMALKGQVRKVMLEWIDESVTNTITFNQNATSMEVDGVHALIGREETLQKSKATQASTLSSSFVDKTSARIHRLTDHIEVLRAYNIRYIDNKTEELQSVSAVVETMLEEASDSVLINVNVSLSQLTETMNDVFEDIHVHLAGVYGEIKEGMDANLNIARTTLSEMDAVTRSLWTEMERALAKADAFYTAVAGGAAAAKSFREYVEDALSSAGVSLDLCSLGDWCDFNPGDWNVAEPNFVDVPVLLNPPTINVYLSLIEPPIEAATAELSAAGETLRSVPANIVATVGDLRGYDVVGFKSDYDPPAYKHDSNASTERVRQEEDSRAFQAVLDSVLLGGGQVFGTAAHATEVVSNASSGETWSSLRNSSLSTATQISSWNLLSQDWMPHVDVEELRRTFASIQQVLYVMDTLYRICQSLVLVTKHWQGMAANLPPVPLKSLDTKIGAATIGGTGSGGGGSIAGRLSGAIQFVTISPVLSLYVVLSLALVLLLCMTLLTLYVPMYETYSDVCAGGSYMDAVQAWKYNDTSSDLSVTGLSSVLFHSSVDYARSSGQQALAEGLPAHDLAASDRCSSYTGQGIDEVEYWSLAEHGNSIEDEYNGCINTVQNVHAAVNMTAMDNALFESGSNHHLQSLPWLDVLRGDRFAPLEPGFFDCTALSSCISTCDGPDLQNIFRGASHTACITEWRLHAVVSQTSLAIIIFICINLSRVMFCKGMFTVLWRRLKSGTFLVVGECKEDGQLILERPPNQKREQVKEGQDSDMMEEMKYSDSDVLGAGEEERSRADRTSGILRQRVQRLTQSTVVMGWIYIVLALVVNVPWVLLIKATKSALHYDVDA